MFVQNRHALPQSLRYMFYYIESIDILYFLRSAKTKGCYYKGENEFIQFFQAVLKESLKSLHLLDFNKHVELLNEVEKSLMERE